MANQIIAVVGGTGLYDAGEATKITPHEVKTPFGAPSDHILDVETKDYRFLFLPRHGRGHRLLPSEINYRANIWALKSLGAAWCISVSAVGSLREQMHPGDVVVPHQVIDKTQGRPNSFFGDGVVAHVSMADPFCPVLRQLLMTGARISGESLGFTVHDGGTYICIDGPTFSTRAESHMYRSWNADVIGMTNLPEAKLAREAEIAYGTLALVTDYDCWRDDGNDVHAHAVADVVRSNASHARSILKNVIPELSKSTPSDLVQNALKQAVFTDLTTVSPERVAALEPILRPYLR